MLLSLGVFSGIIFLFLSGGTALSFWLFALKRSTLKKQIKSAVFGFVPPVGGHGKKCDSKKYRRGGREALGLDFKTFN